MDIWKKMWVGVFFWTQGTLESAATNARGIQQVTEIVRRTEVVWVDLIFCSGRNCLENHDNEWVQKPCK